MDALERQQANVELIRDILQIEALLATVVQRREAEVTREEWMYTGYGLIRWALAAGSSMPAVVVHVHLLPRFPPLTVVGDAAKCINECQLIDVSGCMHGEVVRDEVFQPLGNAAQSTDHD